MIESSIIVIVLLSFPFVAFLFANSKNKIQFVGNESISNFILGNKKINTISIAAGISMSFVGGAATLNMASLGYQYGWSAIVDPIAVFTALIIVVFLAKKIRSGNNITITELLTESSPKLKIILGITSFTVYQLLTAAQFVALSKLLYPYFPNISPTIIMLVPAIVVFSYIYIRGFQAVNKTDIFQLLLILFLFSIPVIWVIGVSNLEYTKNINNLPMAPLSLLIYLILPLFFIPVSQDVNIRIKAAKSLKSAQRGLIVGGILYVFFIVTSLSIGIFMYNSGYVTNSPENILALFFENHLSSFSIFATIAVLAAIISTLDSFAFDAIASVSNDIFHSNKKSKLLKEKHIILLSTLIVFITGLIIAILYQQILSLILAAMLLYISIFIPVAIGKTINIKDSILVITTVITAILIIISKYISYTPPLEPIIYVTIHIILLLLSRIIQK